MRPGTTVDPNGLRPDSRWRGRLEIEWINVIGVVNLDPCSVHMNIRVRTVQGGLDISPQWLAAPPAATDTGSATAIPTGEAARGGRARRARWWIRLAHPTTGKCRLQLRTGWLVVPLSGAVLCFAGAAVGCGVDNNDGFRGRVFGGSINSQQRLRQYGGRRAAKVTDPWRQQTARQNEMKRAID